MCLLPPISFDNSETFQSLGLEVWGEPSKAAEMFQSSSSLFAENGIGPKLVFARLSRGNRRRSHYEQSDRDIEERDWILEMMGFGLGPRLSRRGRAGGWKAERKSDEEAGERRHFIKRLTRPVGAGELDLAAKEAIFGVALS
jgi:hypothetical protein